MTTRVTPGDDKAAILQSDHFRIILARTGIAVHAKLFTNRINCSIINLPPNIPTGAAAMATAIHPGHNKAAIFKGTDRWHPLFRRSIAVYLKLLAKGSTTAIQVLSVDTPT